MDITLFYLYLFLYEIVKKLPVTNQHVVSMYESLFLNFQIFIIFTLLIFLKSHSIKITRIKNDLK